MANRQVPCQSRDDRDDPWSFQGLRGRLRGLRAATPKATRAASSTDEAVLGTEQCGQGEKWRGVTSGVCIVIMFDPSSISTACGAAL